MLGLSLIQVSALWFFWILPRVSNALRMDFFHFEESAPVTPVSGQKPKPLSQPRLEGLEGKGAKLNSEQVIGRL